MGALEAPESPAFSLATSPLSDLVLPLHFLTRPSARHCGHIRKQDKHFCSHGV